MKRGKERNNKTRKASIEERKPASAKLLKGMWAVVAVALLVRLAHLWESSNNPSFLAPIIDSDFYDMMANHLVKQHELLPAAFFQSFGYIIFLASTYLFSGSSIVAAKMLQALLGAVACGMVYRLGKALFGEREGEIAGFAAALYGPFILYDAELLTAGLEVLWTATVLLLLVQAKNWSRARSFVLLGVMMAVGIVVRATFLPFGILASAYLGISLLVEKPVSRTIIHRLGGLALGWLLILLPVTGLCWSHTGAITFMPTSGGINFFIGNNENYDDVMSVRPGIHYQTMLYQSFKEGLVLSSDQERSRYFLKKTIAYATAHPIGFLKGLGRKSLELASSRELPNITSEYIYREWSLLLSMLLWTVGGFGFPFGLVLALAAPGLLFSWRKVPVAVWLFLVSVSGAIVLTHVCGRYRLPLVVPLLVLAARGSVVLRDFWKAGDRRRLALCAGAMACTVVVSVVPGPFIQERIPYKSEFYNAIGGYYANRGEVSAAEEAFNKALQIDSGNAVAHSELGSIFMKRNDYAVARRHFEDAVQADPDYFDAINNLGIVLGKLGNYDEAVEWCKKALPLSPDQERYVQVLVNLGLAYSSEGDLVDSEQVLNEALTKKPQMAEAHDALGVLRMRQGRTQDAVACFTTALTIEPDLVQVRVNLGAALSDLGRYPEAMVELLRSVRDDPRSARAYYNLGLTQERTGDLTSAAASYEEAVRIAPGYDLARMRLGFVSQQNLGAGRAETQ